MHEILLYLVLATNPLEKTLLEDWLVTGLQLLELFGSRPDSCFGRN